MLDVFANIGKSFLMSFVDSVQGLEVSAGQRKEP
jgi:hypothetical protein